MIVIFQGEEKVERTQSWKRMFCVTFIWSAASTVLISALYLPKYLDDQKFVASFVVIVIASFGLQISSWFLVRGRDNFSNPRIVASYSFSGFYLGLTICLPVATIFLAVSFYCIWVYFLYHDSSKENDDRENGLEPDFAGTPRFWYLLGGFFFFELILGGILGMLIESPNIVYFSAHLTPLLLIGHGLLFFALGLYKSRLEFLILTESVKINGETLFIHRETGMLALDLSGRGISTLLEVEDLQHAKNIQILNLSQNDFTEIDSTLSIFPNLEVLNLNMNAIRDLNNFSVLEPLGLLKEILLEENHISAIPPLKHPALELLSLARNSISQVANLSGLKNLVGLDLSGNAIDRVDDIGIIPNLRGLSLSNNRLRSTKGLEKLVSLQSLDLANNQISEFDELKSILNIPELFTEGNPISREEPNPRPEGL